MISFLGGGRIKRKRNSWSSVECSRAGEWISVPPSCLAGSSATDESQRRADAALRHRAAALFRGPHYSVDPEN